VIVESRWKRPLILIHGSREASAGYRDGGEIGVGVEAGVAGVGMGVSDVAAGGACTGSELTGPDGAVMGVTVHPEEGSIGIPPKVGVVAPQVEQPGAPITAPVS
jgi:hypothetical protein